MAKKIFELNDGEELFGKVSGDCWKMESVK